MARSRAAPEIPPLAGELATVGFLHPAFDEVKSCGVTMKNVAVFSITAALPMDEEKRQNQYLPPCSRRTLSCLPVRFLLCMPSLDRLSTIL